jgi:hypothetical protein
MWPIIAAGGLILTAFFSVGLVVGRHESSEKIYQLEQQIEVQKGRVEEMSGYQTTVGLLTDDLKKCLDDFEIEVNEYSQLSEDFYQCRVSLTYCRKVCGEKDAK